MRKNNLDNVPAMLSEGEQVASNNALDKVLGRQLIPAANKIALGLKESNMKPVKYADGTTTKSGVQIPRLGKPLDKGNGLMGNTAIPGVNKSGLASYSQVQGFVPTDTVRTPTGIYPLRYADGTQDEQGVPPPGLMETLRGIINAGNEPDRQAPQQLQPKHYDAPSLDEARKNYELQHGVQHFADGGVVKDPYYNPDRELEAQRAMKANPFVRVSPQQNQPSLFDEATRSVGNVLNDYTSKIPSLGLASQAAPKPAAPVTNQPAVTQPPAAITPAIGRGNIGMNAIPSRVSDAGLPYNTAGNTVNFTNPNGSGQGSISERMPVNGGLAARMNDGKGSFNVMKLESPYGAGGRPPELAQPQQVQYTNDAPDYTNQIQGFIDTLGAPPVDPRFGGFNALIADKKARQNAKAGLSGLIDLQQGNQDYAYGHNRLAQEQNQFTQGYGLDRQRAQREAEQQQFNNKLGLADIGFKQQSAQAQGQRDSERFALEKVKAAPQLHQSQMLEAIQAAMASGKTNTPQFTQLQNFYQMAFGKNPLDDLTAGLSAGINK